jgi:NAD(P)H-nitrite reductase large subunit
MLPIQLDKHSATVYEKAFEKEGLKQYYSNGIALVGSENGVVKRVVLKNGKILPCDLLISAAGIRSNIEFLKESEVNYDNKGLLFDEKGETNIPNIYGAGDVSGRAPIWPVAVKEGIIAAYNMSGIEKSMDDFFASKATMNFLGIPTMSLGITSGYDESYIEEIDLDNLGNYKKIIHKDGVIHGAILQGDLSYAGILTQLIRLKIDVSKVKKRLFDIDYSDFFHTTENFEFTYDEVK